MYIKGASRRSVRFWSRHLLDRDENQRVEVIEKRGLESDEIRGMMTEMQEDAKFTRASNFMFVASFSPCPHERLTEQQWDRAYEIFEKQRGIPDGQPRFVVEHEKDGRVHRHVVWSRTDLETMRAFPDGKNVAVCVAAKQEIEIELGLERTPIYEGRDPTKARSPKPYEMFRGMKTGIDPRDITKEVTMIFHSSQNAHDFIDGLAQHGYDLVRGDRRDFCIIDEAGKEHSLARRLDGVNTKELKAYMQDVDVEYLPTVAQAKARFAERNLEAMEADLETVQREIAWEERLAKAAIEKEKLEGRFVEPTSGETRKRQQGERLWPLRPPVSELTATPPRLHFEDASRELEKPDAPMPGPEHLRGTTRVIWESYNIRTWTLDEQTARSWEVGGNKHLNVLERDPERFRQKIEEAGLALAVVTREEADLSQRTSEAGKAGPSFLPRYKEGEIVAVTEEGFVYKLSQRTTGHVRHEVERFLKPMDRSGLVGIEETRVVLAQRVEERTAEIQPFRDVIRDNGFARREKAARNIYANAPSMSSNTASVREAVRGVHSLTGKGMKTGSTAFGIASVGMDAIANAFESLTATPLSPEQKIARELAAQDAQEALERAREESRQREDRGRDR